MSYDINFWKQPAGYGRDPQATYEMLSRGEPVPELLDLPVDAVLADLQAQFLGFDPKERFPLMHSPSQERDESGSVEVIWSPKHFRFDLRGESAEAFNMLVDILTKHGAAMYDPQVGTRYATNDGTGALQPPRQEPMTEAQREELERMKAQLLSQFAGARAKKGCRARAAMFMLLLALLAAMAIGQAW